jgi:outer membrane autotransporter protein
MVGINSAPASRGQVRRPRSLHKAALLSGSAIALTFLASAAQAQCTSAPLSVAGNRFGGGIFDFGVTSSGTVSAVQSLTAVLNTTNTAFLTQNSAFVAAPPNPAPYQPGGGVWVRGTGGQVDTRTPASFTYSGNILSPDGGAGTCDTRTSQRYGGVQAGADISRLNIDGANVHIGVTAGYTESSISSPTGSGVFRGDFQVPFAGIYAAVTKGGFFADTQVRGDFYQGRLNDPSNGLFDQGLDARSMSIIGNVGNQFPLGNDWFVEPSAGVVYSRVNVDRLALAGTFVLANSPGFAAPSRVDVNDFDSVLGRASLRVGKNFIVDGFALQGFFTASVFNEFSGNVRTNINTSFGELDAGLAPLDAAAVVSSERIGAYGQFALGLAGQILNTGWLGFVRGDYRIGDRVEGIGISGGLRYQFTPEQLARTGIVRKGRRSGVAVLPTLVNWTGFSIGGSLGALRDETEQRLDLGAGQLNRVRPIGAGVLAGGQVGYDHQFGAIVLGVAGDIAYTNAEGAKSCPTKSRAVLHLRNQDRLPGHGHGPDRLRLGPHALLRQGRRRIRRSARAVRSNTFGSRCYRGGRTALSNLNDTSPDYSAVGWTIGAGVEFAYASNWSAKAEYMHYELEDRRLNLLSTVSSVPASAEHTGDLVRVGLNYRFSLDAPQAVMVAPARPVVRKF